MRHGLDLISKKSLRRWSPKKKWNSRHIYLGKTCKAFDMRWLNISKRPRIHSHSPCARRVQSWEWSKISFEPDGRSLWGLINKNVYVLLYHVYFFQPVSRHFLFRRTAPCQCPLKIPFKRWPGIAIDIEGQAFYFSSGIFVSKRFTFS